MCLKNDRGVVAPSTLTAFSLVDPATGKRITVREMTDEEIIRHSRNVAAQIGDRMNRAMRALAQQVPDQSQLPPVLALLEQCRMATGMSMVLEYEQNRRANVGALVVP
jgi:antitoxin component of RelBE/YafQ-DinJ toxin-antitoxin module